MTSTTPPALTQDLGRAYISEETSQAYDEEDPEYSAGTRSPTSGPKTSNKKKTPVPVAPPASPAEASQHGPDEHVAAPKPPASSKAAASLGSRCPSWSSAQREDFQSRCGAWLSAIDQWQDVRSKQPPVSYMCVIERACHGLGDRMAGVQSSLSMAMLKRRPFRVLWSGLSDIFTSCVFTNEMGAWWDREWRGGAKDVPMCKAHAQDNCQKLFRVQEKCDLKGAFSFGLYNIERACVPPAMCRLLGPQVTTAELFGCPLRAMFEPRPDFLNFTVKFREGLQEAERSVEDIATIMRKYYVIGIHFRLGDLAAFVTQKKGLASVEETNESMLIPFRCAHTIQSHLEQRARSAKVPQELASVQADEKWAEKDDEFLVNGKPVRWFFASDTQRMRSMAMRIFGGKLLMVDEAPKHIALDNLRRSRSALFTTFAEWYLLGLADKLVMNRYGEDGVTEGHTVQKNRLYEGRLSSFPKMSWAYHLKSLTYDAWTCREVNMPVDGTWKEALVATQDCPVLAQAEARRAQPHLAGLPKPFPDSWVLRGEVKLRPAEVQVATAVVGDGQQEEQQGLDGQAQPRPDEQHGAEGQA